MVHKKSFVNSKDFSYNAEVRKLEALPGAYSFAIKTVWRGAKNPSEEKTAFQVTLGKAGLFALRELIDSAVSNRAAPKKVLRKRATVKSWNQANMRETWTWEVFVTRRSDGSFSTGARQFGPGLRELKLKGTYRIRSAKKLKAALESIFAHEFIAWEKEIEWETILSRLAKLDQKISSELAALLIEEAKQNRLEEEEAERVWQRQQPTDQWILRANWPRSTSRGAGGIPAAIEIARLRNAVYSYTRRYFADHGAFPTGEHVIDEEVGSSAAAHAAAERRDGIGRAFANPGRIKLVVQFPLESGQAPEVL